MNTKSLLDKLISTERVLNIYDDNNKKELVKEIKINIPLAKLKEIVPPRDGDELLYISYILNKIQLDTLNEILGNVNKIDFNSYYYVLECIGTYKW
ncbi:hypothetical protein GA0116948_1259 [Chitinophaga costaii]|uniref:DUF7683 domain-containing protein n=1 Tax=Chitinophaga costaii TaxID=1335309 RepID=A0A1C4G6H1_9BACT|nr:hypothetical protein [Chitinophaga costaii]PUZ19594.1 hypothetical protein DCM91_20385 [Chitinophaga costaii]SCC63817.1 hypothetical protein GA0116948_1259 [Chitinophaga costaii]